MSIELVVPSVGESVTKVQIGAWLKGEGSRVEKDQGIVEIETDKATIELPAPSTGTVTKVLKKAGESAKVGEIIGYMEPGVAAVSERADADRPAPAVATATKSAPAPVTEQPFIMPAARRAMHEQRLQPEQITPTGPSGRMLKEDVLRAAESRSTAAQPGGAGASNGRAEEIVPFTPLRRRIAERLVEASQTAALLTTFNEVDMSAASGLRKEYQEAFQQRYGVKLGFMSFFVKAAIDALKQLPQLNAEIRELAGADGEVIPHIVYKNYYDIGVAVSGAKGLVVPVLRGADRMSFAEVETAIAELGKRARENKISIEELQGGTFTISNGGVFGSMMSTPIVNPPQVAILGLHAIQDRPVARDGQVVIRPMMYVALTYDHRIVDGREAVTFLKRIKDCVENPTRMLIEI